MRVTENPGGAQEEHGRTAQFYEWANVDRGKPRDRASLSPTVAGRTVEWRADLYLDGPGGSCT
jgi:hypothetical protein